jgi:hypothetical protein
VDVDTAGGWGEGLTAAPRPAELALRRP